MAVQSKAIIREVRFNGHSKLVVKNVLINNTVVYTTISCVEYVLLILLHYVTLMQ